MKMISIKNIKNCMLLAILLLTATLSAQVGVETNDPKTNLDVNGAMSFREGPELVLSNGYNNNINLGIAPFSFYRITGPTAAFYITGIVPQTGSDGQIVVLQNDTDQGGNEIMLIVNNSGSSTAANRIFLPGQSEYMVRGRYATITLQYSANQSRWILLNNMNRVQTYYTPATFLNDGAKTTITITAPEVTQTSGITINLVNNSGLPDSEKFNLIVEYVEAKNGSLIFRVNNKNPQTGFPPWIYSGVTVQYALTYFIN
ncbi:hypothetical protein POV26_06105 [Aequorivita todarodis]|uniref:hypothetical protein n=1 Tax=Aequorivita todarodis TaxID=2036821 RepID=UPI002350E22D|nr:hypothetical protein [Aequorivita todarodis]MDC8000600.1 hypothetical protein [Aequorivita todarodis]